MDKEYFACLVEVAACGSAAPGNLLRPSIRSKLSSNSALQRRLTRALETLGQSFSVEPEVRRVERVVVKIAKGLRSFKNSESSAHLEATTLFGPFKAMHLQDQSRFLQVSDSQLWPEVGSRMFVRSSADLGSSWVSVQEKRFSYAVETQQNGTLVKMLIRNYLAATVKLTWQKLRVR